MEFEEIIEMLYKSRKDLSKFHKMLYDKNVNYGTGDSLDRFCAWLVDAIAKSNERDFVAQIVSVMCDHSGYESTRAFAMLSEPGVIKQAGELPDNFTLVRKEIIGEG